MRLRCERGTTLIFTLLLIVVLLTLGSIFILRSINEWNTSQRERQLTQAFYISEGGSHVGLSQLDSLINSYLLNTISTTIPSSIISGVQNYVATGNGLGFLLQYVQDSGSAQFIDNTTELIHSVGSIAFGEGAYQFDIIVTEKANPFASGLDQWDFPYYYKVESTGGMNGNDRKVQLHGDFTVRVQRDNFAKYALFTNAQTLPSGTNVWFTDKTNFAGPIHTNARYNIALNPSGTFDGLVTQVEQTARYYNSGAPLLLDADFNGIKDVPTFNAGFQRNQSAIALSSSTQKQDMIDQATGMSAISGNGIYVPNDGSNLTGGIYVEGDATLNMNVNAGNAVYTLVQGGTTKIVTVDRATNQTSVETVSIGIETFSGIPDGIDDVGTLIYVNGNINSIGGTVQGDSELTVSSDNNINITNHIVYEDYTAAVGSPGDAGYVPPHADGEMNLLGIVSWEGNISVGTAAPDDLNIHGSLLAQGGIFAVTNYNDTGVGPRGTATLLGGVISDYYGAFGLFNGSTGQQLSGYGRNFVYDGRMLVGRAPPYFPSLNTFVAFTNDIMDKITLQEGGF